MVIVDFSGAYSLIVNFCHFGHYWSLIDGCCFLSFRTFFDAMPFMFSSCNGIFCVLMDNLFGV